MLSYGEVPLLEGSGNRITVAVTERRPRLVWRLLWLAALVFVQLALIGYFEQGFETTLNLLVALATQILVIIAVYVTLRAIRRNHTALLHLTPGDPDAVLERRYIFRTVQERLPRARIRGFHIHQSLHDEVMPHLVLHLDGEDVSFGYLPYLDGGRALGAEQTFVAEAKALTGLDWGYDDLVGQLTINPAADRLTLAAVDASDWSSTVILAVFLEAVLVVPVTLAALDGAEGGWVTGIWAASLAVTAGLCLLVWFHFVRWAPHAVELDRRLERLELVEIRHFGRARRSQVLSFADIEKLEVEPCAGDDNSKVWLHLPGGSKAAVHQALNDGHAERFAAALRLWLAPRLAA